MSRCHFVYVGDPNDHGNQISSCVIGRKIYWMLRDMFDEVIYHQWDNQTQIQDVRYDDVIIGHPNYPTNTPTRQLFRHNVKYKALIFPLHTHITSDNWPFDDLVQLADDVFSIQGPYWYDTVPNTIFKNWQPKITRLDMAIDCKLWPYKKNDFNQIGKRSIVYIGSDTINKNLHLLYQIALRMPNQQFEWYGGNSGSQLAKLQNMKIYGHCDILQMSQQICQKNDFIISTSISDANPCTLSEIGLASGLIPLCTQQSGYYQNDPNPTRPSGHFINITLQPETCVQIITEWLNKPTETLQQMSLQTRTMCEQLFTWDIFLNKIAEKLQKHAVAS